MKVGLFFLVSGFIMQIIAIWKNVKGKPEIISEFN
jgi:hypothetical protein